MFTNFFKNKLNLVRFLAIRQEGFIAAYNLGLTHISENIYSTVATFLYDELAAISLLFLLVCVSYTIIILTVNHTLNFVLVILAFLSVFFTISLRSADEFLLAAAKKIIVHKLWYLPNLFSRKMIPYRPSFIGAALKKLGVKIDGITSSFLSYIENVFSLLNILSKASDITVGICAIHQFVTAVGLTSFWDIIFDNINLIMRAFGISNTKSTPFSDLKDWVINFSCKTTLSKHIAVLITYILSLDIIKDKMHPLSSNTLKTYASVVHNNQFFVNTNTIDSVVNSITWILDGGYNYLVNKDPEFYLGVSSFESWYNECTEICSYTSQLKEISDGSIDKYPDLPQLMADLERLIKQYNLIRSQMDLPCGKWSNYADKSMTAKHQQLVAFQKHINEFGLANRSRLAPLVCAFVGLPGVGKTTVMDLMMDQFCKDYSSRFTDEPPLTNDSKNKYAPNSFEERWDGYKSQAILILDDLGQVQAKNKTDKNVEKFIAVVNSAPYLTAQAALEDKGVLPFVGKLVVVTANKEGFDFQSYFNTPEAANRRIPVIYEVSLRNPTDRNEDGRVRDYDIHEINTIYKFSIKILQKGEYNSGKAWTSIGDDLCFYDVLRHFSQRIKMHYDSGQNMVRFKRNLESSPWCEHGVREILCTQEHVCKDEVSPTSAVLVVSAASIYRTTRIISIFLAFISVGVRSTGRNIVDAAIENTLLYYPSDYPNYNWWFQKRWAHFKRTGNDDHISHQMCRRVIMYNQNPYDDDPIDRAIGPDLQSLLRAAEYVRIFGYVLLASAAFGVATYKFSKRVDSAIEQPDKKRKYNPGKFDLQSEEEIWRTDIREDVWKVGEIQPFTQKQLTVPISDVLQHIDRAKYVLSSRSPDEELGSDGKVKVQVNICYQFQPHWFITVYHSFDLRERGIYHLVRNGIRKTVVTVHFSEVHLLPSHHLAIFQCSAMEPAKSIEDYFFTGDALERPITCSSQLWQACADGTTINKGSIVAGCSYFKKMAGKSFKNYPDVSHVYRLPNVPGEEGMCGSLVLLKGDKAACVYGLIFAGSLKDVYFVYIPFKTIRRIIDSTICTAPLHPLAHIMYSQLYKMSMSNLSEVSNFRWLKSPHINGEILGTLPFNNSRMRSKVHKNPLFYEIVERYEPKVATYTHPTFNSEKSTRANPVRVNLEKLLDQKPHFPKELVHKAMKSYLDRYESECNIHPPLSWTEGANRWRKQPSIRLNTSCGFPQNRLKSKLVDLTKDKKIIIKDDDLKILDIILDLYKRRIRVKPIFTCALKDEKITIVKNDGGEVRMFTGSPWLFSIIVRCYFLPLIEFLEEDPIRSEMAVGVNSFSSDWGKFHDHLNIWGNRCVAGDFKRFDKSMPADIILASFSILIELARRAGYDNSDLVVMSMIAYDTAYPTVIAKGDVCTVFGSNPSGHPLTVIINSIANSLYHRVAFYYCNKNLVFNSSVRIMTYGDDSIFSVAPHVNFGFHQCKDVFALVGITYTTAGVDKSGDSANYCDLSEITFLKRRFWSTVINGTSCVLDPIEPFVLYSMLAWSRKCHLTEQDRSFQVLFACHLELVRQPQEVREAILPMLTELNEKLEIAFRIDPFPQWDCIEEAMKKSKFTVTYSELSESWLVSNTSSRWKETLFSYMKWTSQKEVRSSTTSSVRIHERKLSITEPRTDLLLEDDMNEADIMMMKNLNINNNNDNNFDDEEETLEGFFIPLSSSVVISNDPTVKTETTAIFADGEEQIGEGSLSYIGELDFLPGNDKSNLESFLSRPTIIADLTWTHGSRLTTSVDPWRLFLTNTVIARKLDDFALVNGTLRIEVLVNGTPFHMGRLNVGYFPFGTGNFLLTCTDEMRVCQLTQCPGTRDNPLAPNKSPRWSMDIPFFYPYPYLNIVDYRAAGASDQDNVGDLHFRSTALQTANGTVVDVNIRVLAYFVPGSCTLAVPRPISSYTLIGIDECFEVSPTFLMNSGVSQLVEGAKSMVFNPENEDKPDGLVSTVTSAVANASQALAKVPVIGEYAQAGSQIFTQATRFFKFFGFSRPTVYTDTVNVKNFPISNLAITVGAENVQKLTFDPKQQLTLDPRVANLSGEDQLALAYLKKRWSCFAEFTWATSDVPGDLLLEWLVMPGMNNVAAGIGQQSITSFISFPFQYWRGGLEYKIVFGTSHLQSGRLAITYDPYGVAHVATASNQQYMLYVDLSQTDEVCFDTSWMQPIAWKEVIGTISTAGHSTVGIIYNEAIANGSLRISVVNPLMSPNPVTLTAMIYIRGCDDLEFAAPRDLWQQSFTPYPVPISGTGSGELMASSPTLQMGGRSTPNEHISTVYFGEKIISFRPMMKRYQLHHAIEYTVTSTGTLQSHKMDVGGFPCPFSDVLVVGKDTWTATGDPVNTALMTYLRGAYAGWRGSIRWKVLPVVDARVDIDTIYANRNTAMFGSTSTFTPSSVSVATVAATGVISNIQTVSPSKWSGAVATSFDNQPVLEYEVPFYNTAKFCRTNFVDTMRNSADDFSNEDHLTSSVYVQHYGTISGSKCSYEFLVAAGEDFDLMYFIACPPWRTI